MADRTIRELQTQADITAKIAQSLAGINRALGDQLKRQMLINEASKGGAVDAAAVSQQADEALRRAGASASSVTSAAAGGTAAVTGELDKQAISAKQMGGAVVDTVKHIGKTYDDTLKLISTKAKGPLRDAYSELQRELGGLMGPAGVGAAVDGMSNEMVGKFRDINLKVRGELYDTDSKFKLFGMPLAMAVGDLEEVMSNFNEVALRQGVVNGFAMMRDATHETAIEMKLFGDALGYDAEKTSTFVQRQISLTGQAGTDMLREAASMAKAMEKQTGISAKVIGYSIEKIVEDTKNFGNVTVEEAARMSAALTQLGVGYDDLASMVGKFQAFDSAVGSVSALTTVFGIQIDAMEMMKLANEDQETFLRRMRDSFLQAGRSADTMTLAQKRLVAEQLGLSDIEAVERLLDPTKAISSMEELTAATAAAPEEAQAVIQSLGEDILNFQNLTKFGTEEVRTFIEQGVRQPFVQAEIAAEQAAAKIAGAFSGAIGTGSAKGTELLAKNLKDIAGIDTDITKKLEDNLAGTATSVQSIMAQVTGGNFSEAMAELTKSLGTLNVGGSMTSGVTDAVKSIEKAFKDMAKNIIQSLKDAKIIPNSPDDILTETLNKVGFTAKHTGDVWESSFAKAGISTKDLTRELKDQSSVYSKLGKELAFQGLQYKDLDADNKKMIKDRLQLGDISEKELEKQLKMIMGGKGAAEGKLRKSRETFAKDILEYTKASGQDISSFSDDFIQSMEDQHGMNRETLASALEEGSDIGEIVTEAGKAKYEKEDTKGKGTSATGQRAAQKSRDRAEGISKLHTKELRRANQLLEMNNDILTTTALDIKGTLDKLHAALGTSDTVTLNIDGRHITDAVIRNPTGLSETGRVSISNG